MKSRNYSESEKSAVVERFLVGGESVSTIAADTGISSGTNGTILGTQREERNFGSEFNKSMMKVSKSLEQERLLQL